MRPGGFQIELSHRIGQKLPLSAPLALEAVQEKIFHSLRFLKRTNRAQTVGGQIFDPLISRRRIRKSCL